MTDGDFKDYEVQNMKEDALEAIDTLKAIVKECDRDYVCRAYLKEKVEKAKWCVNYIAEVIKE